MLLYLQIACGYFGWGTPRKGGDKIYKKVKVMSHSAVFPDH